jgi:hypothetical protein
MNELHKCSDEGGCPFACTDISDIIQNYGCLPEPLDIVNMRVTYGKTWACHANPTKPCLGALKWLDANGYPYQILDTNLVTEDSDWHQYCRKESDPTYPSKYQKINQHDNK